MHQRSTVSTTDSNHEVAKTPNNDGSGHVVLNKFLSNENQSHSNRLLINYKA